MVEKYLFSALHMDKTLTNPVNSSEVFNCGDLFAEYKKCKVFRKKGLSNNMNCKEIRYLAQKCYTYSESDFKMMLAKNFEEKRQYLEYLKSHNSILYTTYREDPSYFAVLKFEEQESGQPEEMNDFLMNSIARKTEKDL